MAQEDMKATRADKGTIQKLMIDTGIQNLNPKRSVGRASFRYLDGSSDSFPIHKLFQAKITPITQGPSAIWFSMTLVDRFANVGFGIH